MARAITSIQLPMHVIRSSWHRQCPLLLGSGAPYTTKNGSLRAVLWNETFVQLNDTDWGARSGIDQTRTFVGIGLPVGSRVTIEPGYLNQIVYRPGPNRMNHIAALNVFARF